MTTDAMRTPGIEFKRGDGGSPETFTLVGEVYDVKGPGGQSKEIDASHFQSTAVEVLLGLPDEGEVTLQMNLVPADTQQKGLWNDRKNQTLRNFRIVLTDAALTTLAFSAYVKGFSIGMPKDDKISAEVTLRVSGPVTGLE